MKHKLFFISALFLLQSLNAQWAGSTSDGGSERVQVKQNTKNNTSEKRGRLTLGLGIGGYAQDLCEASLPISPDYGSGFITSYTSNPDPTGFNVFMNGMQKTGYRNLWVGFEWGLGYAGKTVEYEYYTSLGNYYTGSTDIDYLHMGIGIPIRYYFVESNDLDLYAQGVFGYGFVGDVTNDDDIPGIYYGGGSFGARWTILFAELGYNSTGYLRFGLSIPTVK